MHNELLTSSPSQISPSHPRRPRRATDAQSRGRTRRDQHHRQLSRPWTVPHTAQRRHRRGPAGPTVPHVRDPRRTLGRTPRDHRSSHAAHRRRLQLHHRRRLTRRRMLDRSLIRPGAPTVRRRVVATAERVERRQEDGRIVAGVAFRSSDMSNSSRATVTPMVVARSKAARMSASSAWIVRASDRIWSSISARASSAASG